MNVALFTSDTLHHLKFTEVLSKHHKITNIIFDTKQYRPPFAIQHPFEIKRDTFEKEVWFKNKMPSYSNYCHNIQSFEALNGDQSINYLKKISADVGIVFGTGKLSKPFINNCSFPLLNLHGGDPELYRGLDSHLWAIYHNDFNALKTCLHFVETTLDTGNVIKIIPLKICHNMKLHELRMVNTQVCIDLVLESLEDYKSQGQFKGDPQKHKGRYYSFMPGVLKDICCKKFQRYTDSIK